MTTLPAWFLPILGTIIAILLAVFGYVIKLAQEVSEVKENHRILAGQHEHQLNCIPELKRSLDLLTGRMELYMKVLDPHLAGIIHSPLHVQRDLLVDKLVNGVLTHDESMTLACELKELLRQENDVDRKLAAALLLARVEWELSKAGKRTDV
jgi:hypothetical protein